MKTEKSDSCRARSIDTEKHRQPISIGIAFSQVSVLSVGLLLAMMSVNQNATATSWTPEQVVSLDVGSWGNDMSSIGVNASKVHVVWQGTKAGYDAIYYRHFDGAGWQPEMELSQQIIGTIEFPSIAVVGDKVHVVWSEEDSVGGCFVTYRHFDGSTWQAKQRITMPIGMEYTWKPSVAADGDEVHVVWADSRDGDFDIYHKYFDGSVWQPDQEISVDVGTEHQTDPSIAVNSSRVHVVWQEGPLAGNRDIFYRHFDGVGWQPMFEISGNLDSPTYRNPSIAVVSDKAHVVWNDMGDGNADIYYRYFDGGSWQVEQEISTDVGAPNQWDPSIAAEGSRVYVSWTSSVGDYDIHYRHFDGTSWWAEQEISTDTGPEPQEYSSIAVDGNGVHVIWEDKTGGNRDIYYRNGTTGSDITPPNSNAHPILPYWQPSSAIDIEWSATDDLDLANVTLFHRYSSDNFSWGGWQEWAYDKNISGTSATGIFSFTTISGEGFYQFYTIANDSVGNLESPPTTSDSECGHDLTRPSSSVDIIFPYLQMSSTLEVNVTAADVTSGVSEVTLHYASSLDNMSWNPGLILPVDYTYPWSWIFDFPAGEGFYQFKSEAVDSAGNTELWPGTPDMIALYSTPSSPLSNVQASLFGPNQEDVRISWQLSPDDGGGKNDTVRYDISRGIVFDSAGSTYTLYDFVTSGTSSYVDVKAGEGDPSDYFYVICSVNRGNFSSCATEQAGKFTRQLSAGTNLVSIPLIQSDESIGNVLQSVEYDKAWTYDSANGEWKHKTTFKPYPGELSSIDRTMGLWVDVTRNCNFTLAGIVPASTTIQLHAGWNLVGFPSFDPTYAVADLKAATSSSRVEGYNSLAPYHLRVLGNIEVPQAGYGYWVWVDAASTLILNP